MNYSRLLLICLTGAILFIRPISAMRQPSCAVLGEGTNTHRFPQRNWNLKYGSGSLGLKRGQWLKAAFIGGSGTSQGDNPTVTISTDELREVYFKPKAEKESDSMEHMARSGCGYAKELTPKSNPAQSPRIFVAWLVSPGTVKRGAEHLNERYPIRLVWNDAGTEKELLFSVRSCEYASFLANLRWAVGQRWKDIEHDFPK